MTPMPDSATNHRTWLRRADRWVPPTRHRIAGADEDGSGASFRDRSPRDGRELAVVADAGEREVDRAVHATRRASDSGPWPRLSPAARGRVLLRLGDLIEEHRPELALAVSPENGKPVSEAYGIELPATGATFRWYGQLADKLHDASPHTDPGTLALVTREPTGVVGAVVPWNFPLPLASWKLAPALAAGCTAVLKPSELTPLSAPLLGRPADEAGLPPGVLNVIAGDGPVAGRALGLHPGVDVLAFTGSTAAGRHFLRYAADSNLKRVWLELGGKSPNIVLPDAPDLEPTVFDRVTPDMRPAREEVFGPVLSVLTFDTEEEAVALANDTEYGLAAAAWTAELGTAHRLSRALRAGTVWVNCYEEGGLSVPFGGDVAPYPYGAGAEVHDTVYDVDAEQDAFDLAVARYALASGLPLLAVCRGLQFVNVARGGTLRQDMGGRGYDHRHRVHRVALAAGSTVARARAAPVSVAVPVHVAVLLKGGSAPGGAASAASRAGVGPVEEGEPPLLPVLLRLHHDLPQQVGQCLALLVGQPLGDEDLLRVEGGKHLGHQPLALVRQPQQHQAPVGGVTVAFEEAPALEGAADPRQGALGDAGLRRHVAGLRLAPDPHDPQHDERGPGQFGAPQHGVLEVLSHGRGGTVDVRHCDHLYVPDRCVAQLGLYGLLGLPDGTVLRHVVFSRVSRPRRQSPAGFRAPP